jgi:acyl-CoA oxidase
MRDDPKLFFMAHRLLATRMLGGFGIRFTVQFNLFAGSILGLGDEQQVAMLDEMQEAGELGCFALTEVDAGVMSGMIVETTATWQGGHFSINTPHSGAAKNWISAGMTADWVVFIADLCIAGKSYGPHPFLTRMRNNNGELVPGIRCLDMGPKTVANDLDNARITFENLKISQACLLRRFGDVREGQYVVVDPSERMRIEVIGQRLLTGRLVIAEAALVLM